MTKQIQHTASTTPFDAERVEASKIDLDKLIMEMLVKRFRECAINYENASWLTRWYWKRQRQKALNKLIEFKHQTNDTSSI